MNSKLLIDEIIRQTMVLIAQLATTAGLRAPLSHVASQVFLDLSSELEAQGVRRKVVADMFGLALRSYQLKVQRLMESQTDQYRSLWESIYEFIREEEFTTLSKILLRFHHDDERSVRGILRDLVESSLVFKTGRGDSATYRLASDEELSRMVNRHDPASILALVWIAIYHQSPIRHSDLLEHLSISEELLEEALQNLLAEGRIQEDEVDPPDEEPVYVCQTCVLPMNDPSGWEAALFDHFKAMVTAICIKLRQGRVGTLPVDVIGGSTYSFHVWSEHPFEEEVLALLRETRQRISALRNEVTQFNEAHDTTDAYKVTFYCGQSVIRDEEALTEPAQRDEDD